MQIVAFPTVCSLSSALVTLTASSVKRNSHYFLANDKHLAIGKNTDASSGTFWSNIEVNLILVTCSSNKKC
jgi:hypothetical protein